jgi:predicted acylesterase/phospholipase RssA
MTKRQSPASPSFSARRFLALVASAVLSVSLAACGTLPREAGPIRLASGTLQRTEDPRIRASDAPRLKALVEDLRRRLTAAGPSQSVLALSGGGASGAYGAGVLYGWSQSGQRPTFDIVTGVSTGALAAPYAFLGPAWDEQLRAAYVDGGTKGLLGFDSFRPLVAPSLFSSRGLKALIWKNVTPQMLRQIAAEHAKGRRLLVATTNLDSEETVIWDMGLLATQGDDNALLLFRQVLLASASIPGVFPPVLIKGLTPDGTLIEEMHVDGGVNTPFLGVPDSLLLWTAPSAGPDSNFYVLINGQVDRRQSFTKGTLKSILARSYDSASKASTRSYLTANVAFADRNHVKMMLAAIPSEITASSLDFDKTSMTALFEAGRAKAASGQAWTQVHAQSPVPEIAAPPALDMTAAVGK